MKRANGFFLNHKDHEKISIRIPGPGAKDSTSTGGQKGRRPLKNPIRLTSLRRGCNKNQGEVFDFLAPDFCGLVCQIGGIAG
jgi:hypothetical protein